MGGVNMCLIKIHKFPRIAFKDIVVYKYVLHTVNPRTGYRCVMTPYRMFEITPGKTVVKSKKCILRGIFKSTIEAEGVHALTEMSLLHIGVDVYKAIIPKWSLYYMGEYHDIAASKMFITDKCL